MDKIKRPNRFLYFLAYILTYPVFKICYNLKVNKKGLELPKGPYIVLANHTAMYDFIVVMLTLYPQLLHAVTAHKFYLINPLHILLPMMGCIPKSMFDPDISSILQMKAILKQGHGVFMFPEGRCSISHTYSCIHKATGKLLKTLGVPVISSYIEGSSACMPLWRKHTRYGRMRVTHKNLFSAEDLRTMTVDEINAAIDARLSGEEGFEKFAKPIETYWSRRLAEGLHLLLYYCPQCKQEFTVEAKKNTIRCTSCGFTATMTKQANLIIDNGDIPDLMLSIDDKKRKHLDVSQWFKLQVEHEMQALSDDMEPIVENVKVRMPAEKLGGGTKICGSGVLRIDPSGWHFDGELKGKPTHIFFPVDTIPTISFDYNDNIQIYHKGDFYLFMPEDFRKCLKYTIITECIHNKFASKPLLTKGVDRGFIAKRG